MYVPAGCQTYGVCPIVIPQTGFGRLGAAPVPVDPVTSAIDEAKGRLSLAGVFAGAMLLGVGYLIYRYGR